MLAEVTMATILRSRHLPLGLTLVEVMISVAVLAILIAVAVPSMLDLLERRRVIATANEVMGVLNYAKAETNATNTLLTVRFDPDPETDPSKALSCVAVTTTVAANAACKCYLPEATLCQGLFAPRLLRLFRLPRSSVKFDASAPGGWGGSNMDYQIKFARAQGGIDAQGFQVDVVGVKRGHALRVAVNTAGRVVVCAPNGDFSGYAKCS
ncbi:Tfp pilus assembly protein FimT/FimU [Roseateles sp.]|uniref:pilus assembly FimT family protein n=1 Tax=Roseateles sp. TaxID=1971397 RepID=UPI0039EBC496